MKVDKAEITGALRKVFLPGDVFEIRILDALTAQLMRPHVVSGYFDYDHIDAAADEIEKIRLCLGVYYTPNPVNKVLIARSSNRLRGIEYRSQSTTTDADILCRRWLLIDCDAVRPSGISSSGAEHAAALAKAQEIRSNFAGADWADPLYIDSGNGAQLMYRIDLPRDDGGLVEKLLKKLDKWCSTPEVKIDVTVHNPARIWRLPGTYNCKGDPVEDRPHRMAKIIEQPETPEIVTPAQLRTAVRLDDTPELILPEAAKTGADLSGVLAGVNLADYQQSAAEPFNLDDWIGKYCHDISEPQQWNGGRKWVFDVCPFNPEHRNKSAVITEQANGAIGFVCHHNSCAGNDWRKLRELLEPGYQKKSPPPVSTHHAQPVTAIAATEDADEPDDMEEMEEIEEAKPWRDMSNDTVEAILEGTLLGELVKLYSSVTIPPLPLEAALLKAIVTLGCALSEEGVPDAATASLLPPLGALRARLRINTAGGQVCNVYALLAANSASGKDIGNLLDTVANTHNWSIGTSGSAEGIAEALKKYPNGLISISEFMNWLDEKHWQHKATSFLTEAFSKGFFRHNFSSRGGKGGTSSTDYCFPNIIANIQPEIFEDVVRKQDISSGFMARFLFARMPEFFGDPARINMQKTLERFNEIIPVFQRKHGTVEVPEGYGRSLSDMFKANSPDKLHPVWRRLVNEYMPRFAVMLSVNYTSVTQQDYVRIDSATWSNAEKLVLWFFKNAEQMLFNINDTSQFAKEQVKIYKVFLRLIKKHGKEKGVSMQTISRATYYLGLNSDNRTKILREMEDMGWIISNPPCCIKGAKYTLAKVPQELMI